MLLSGWSLRVDSSEDAAVAEEGGLTAYGAAGCMSASGRMHCGSPGGDSGVCCPSHKLYCVMAKSGVLRSEKGDQLRFRANRGKLEDSTSFPYPE